MDGFYLPGQNNIISRAGSPHHKITMHVHVYQ